MRKEKANETWSKPKIRNKEAENRRTIEKN